MRFLADMGVSRSTAEELRRREHDVVHLSEEKLHRLPDDKILELARRERRVILTFDLDFGDLLRFFGVCLWRSQSRTVFPYR